MEPGHHQAKHKKARKSNYTGTKTSGQRISFRARNALLRHTIGLRNLCHFFIPSERNQNQLSLFPTCFLTPRVSYMYLLQVLIGSLGCLCNLWFARLITLVLVLRYSKNLSNDNDALSWVTLVCQYHIRMIGKVLFPKGGRFGDCMNTTKYCESKNQKQN